jgi:hypothetical protein
MNSQSDGPGFKPQIAALKILTSRDFENDRSKGIDWTEYAKPDPEMKCEHFGIAVSRQLVGFEVLDWHGVSGLRIRDIGRV